MEGNIIDIIIDNGSIDNLISRNAVECLKSKKVPHGKPYQIRWMHNGDAVKVNERVLYN